MGNFSRTSFNPAKGYVGVRLQQGVPLVDSDWNELNDVIRQEVYDGLSYAGGNGVLNDWTIAAGTPLANDFTVNQGTAIVGGRPVSRTGAIKYSAQPWTVQATATRDGVALIPPLTTPTGPRTDLVYLDVWDREVGRSEDGDIVHPAIGVETAVRLKREVAFRVAEGTTQLPTIPTGHKFLPIAHLIRTATANITPTDVIDVRRYVNLAAREQWLSVLPFFQPITASGFSAWTATLSGSASAPRMLATKAASVNTIGMIPVVLPHGARVKSLRVECEVSGSGNFYVALNRQKGTTEAAGVMCSSTISASGPVDLLVQPTTDDLHVVSNSSYYHYIYAYAANTTQTVNIAGFKINYEL